MSYIDSYEVSQQDGMPVECYRFSCGNIVYCYTSRRDDVVLTYIDDGVKRTETYNSTHITRDNIEPGSEGNECEMSITVHKDNPVAKMYQGAPPEVVCNVVVMRMHAQNTSRYDVVYRGRITQVSFEDTACIITVTLENWLSKEIPNGVYQYFCNNVLYGKNCRLNQDDFTHTVFLDKVEDLNVFSEDFREFPDGYFDNGKLYFNDQVRVIKSHKGNIITLRYPFTQKPRNEVTITAGCDRLFGTCVKRFDNALNFTGFPYCPPTDSEDNPTGKGVYWVDGNVVTRDTNGKIGTISGV